MSGRYPPMGSPAHQYLTGDAGREFLLFAINQQRLNRLRGQRLADDDDADSNGLLPDLRQWQDSLSGAAANGGQDNAALLPTPAAADMARSAVAVPDRPASGISDPDFAVTLGRAFEDAVMERFGKGPGQSGFAMGPFAPGGGLFGGMGATGSWPNLEPAAGTVAAETSALDALQANQTLPEWLRHIAMDKPGMTCGDVIPLARDQMTGQITFAAPESLRSTIRGLGDLLNYSRSGLRPGENVSDDAIMALLNSIIERPITKRPTPWFPGPEAKGERVQNSFYRTVPDDTQ